MTEKSQKPELKIARKRVIAKLAEGVFETFNFGIPVNLERIAGESGLTFNYGHYDDFFDGMLEHLSGEFHIYMNLDKAQQGSPRSRFTFAHELGHYYIDEHRTALQEGLAPSHPSYTNFKSEVIVEKEADYFASCLLMPESQIQKDCNKKQFGPQLIDEITKKYKVSATAFLLRYINLGKVPLTVICSKGGKIIWNWQSEDFSFKYLKSIKGSIPVCTATSEFYSKNIEYSTPQSDLFAEDWFNYTNCKANTFRITEYCIYAKNYNMVLTIIWY